MRAGLFFSNLYAFLKFPILSRGYKLVHHLDFRSIKCLQCVILIFFVLSDPSLTVICTEYVHFYCMCLEKCK